jgi:deoxyuridine 5'-triphosphate nucleotidohydrolase
MNNILTYNHYLDAGYDLHLNLQETSSNSQNVADFLVNFYDHNLHWDKQSGIRFPDLYLNGTLVTDFLNSSKYYSFFEVDEPFLLLPPARVAHPLLASGLNNFSNCELVPSSYNFDEPPTWETLLYNLDEALTPLFNYVGYVFPRSGLGAKHQITIANNVGVVDALYRNNVRIALENRGRDIHMFTNGARIAQLVIGVIMNNPYQLKPLKDDDRNLKGFGSSGV